MQDRDKISFEPAECWAGCIDPNCPYSHMDTWRCDDGSPHFTLRDAQKHRDYFQKGSK